MLNLTTALLQVLIEGQGYGLELARRLNERSNGALNPGQGALYPALRALEREGLVRSWESDPLPERGGRPRRYYELTAEGRRAARDERRTLTTFLGLREVRS
jgi:PadR family transcriptional regulator PadR